METNQSTEILEESEELDLPILDIEDEPDTTEESETSEEVTQTVEESPFLSVKYNKEDRNLTREEAITFAQKGMNYDKLNERYTNQHSILEKLASANNLSVEDFLNELQTAQNSYAISSEVERLREQYPDADEELLKALATERVEHTPRVSESEKRESEHQAEINRQFESFKKRFPTVDAASLDDEVYQLMDEGHTLLEAYSIVENNKNKKDIDSLSARIKELENMAEKRKKSYGNTSNTGEVDEASAFERFLFSDD